MKIREEFKFEEKREEEGGASCRLGFSDYQDVLADALKTSCCGEREQQHCAKGGVKLWTLIVHDEVKLSQDVVATNA